MSPAAPAPTAPALLVPARFSGPPRSGNGGWTAGAAAAQVVAPSPDGAWPSATVVLRMPPPLDTPLPVALDGDAATATHQDRPVVVARPGSTDPVPVAPVSATEARQAEKTYAGHASHPFPTCVVCGTEREPGDGLRIFPGRIGPAPVGPAPVDPGPVGAAADEARVGATWTPTASMVADDAGRASYPVTWAALDCAGAWAADLEDRWLVLGTMTARIERLPEVGQEHVVVGAARGTQGRKTFTATSIYAPDGSLVGAAEHVWIEVDPADFA